MPRLPFLPHRKAWSAWRAARERAETLKAERERVAAEADDLTARLAELDRLSPAEGEAAALAEERAILGAAEKTLSEIASARDHADGVPLVGHVVKLYKGALERNLGAQRHLVQPL